MHAHLRPLHQSVSLASSIKRHVSDPQPLTRTPAQHALHQISSDWRLGSSSDTPVSEDGSLYNASMAHSSCQTDAEPDKENRRDSAVRTPAKAVSHKSDDLTIHTPTPDMVRFVNRPEGTPLFTIIEQHSLATLRSKASNLAFSVCVRQGDATRSNVHLQETIVKGPKAASADDLMFLGSQRRQRAPSTDSTSLTRTDRPLEPLQPPFDPPFRCETPPGVKRWPTDPRSPQLPRCRRGVWRATVGERRVQFYRRLLVFIRRGCTSYQRTSARPWRPPASGHYTAGHEGQGQTHPFQTASSTRIRSHSPGVSETRDVDWPPQSWDGPSIQETSRQTRPGSTLSAQRTLEAISGNAFPIRPAPASLMARPRTSLVPRDAATQNLVRLKPQTAPTTKLRGHANPSDTLRTIDIIEQFPRPPVRSGTGLPGSSRGPIPLFAPLPPKTPPVIPTHSSGAATHVVQGESIKQPDRDTVPNTVPPGCPLVSTLPTIPISDSAICLPSHILAERERRRQGSSDEGQGHKPASASGGDEDDTTRMVRVDPELGLSIQDTPISQYNMASSVSRDGALRGELENTAVLGAGPEGQEQGSAAATTSEPGITTSAVPTRRGVPPEQSGIVQHGGPASRQNIDTLVIPTTVTYFGRLCPHVQHDVLVGSRTGRGTRGRAKHRVLRPELSAGTAEAGVTKVKTHCWKCRLEIRVEKGSRWMAKVCFGQSEDSASMDGDAQAPRTRGTGPGAD